MKTFQSFRRHLVLLAALQFICSCGETVYSGPDANSAPNEGSGATSGGHDEIKPVQNDAWSTGVPACLNGVQTRVGSRLPFAPQELPSQRADEQNDETLRRIQWDDEFDGLLRRNVTPEKGWVDYQALAERDAPRLQTLIQGLRDLPWPDPAEKGAWVSFWLNTYHVIMIQQISARPGLVDIAKANLFDELFENHKTWVAGRSLSLNEIEYCVTGLAGNCKNPNLKAEFAQSAPYEPRMHVGYVCAARSCPRLRNFAYRPENVDQVLEENLYLFFNDASHIRANPFSVSELLQWFERDFSALQTEVGVSLARAYTTSACRSDAADVTESFESAQSFRELPKASYDWAVNRQ